MTKLFRILFYDEIIFRNSVFTSEEFSILFSADPNQYSSLIKSLSSK